MYHEPAGLRYSRYSMWSPQQLCHSPEDRGQCEASFEREMKYIENDEGKVVLGPTIYQTDKDFSIPDYYKNGWTTKIFKELEKTVKIQKMAIEHLQAKLQNQQTTILALLAEKEKREEKE
ncbi:hypothetical protein ACOMHN_018638 [Nucella lapillus]